MIRIFIIDDHTVVKEGIKRIIEGNPDMTVVGEANTSEDALRDLGRKDFQVDVLLLDIALPGRGGLDTLHHLKSVRPSLKTLVLSMYPEDQFAVRVLRAGAYGYLTKEAASEQLINAITSVSRSERFVTQATIKKLIASIDKDVDQKPHEQLSDREFDVMHRLASGKSVTEIGHILSLSVKTISTVRSRILSKMGFKTNAELTHYAVLHDLVT